MLQGFFPAPGLNPHIKAPSLQVVSCPGGKLFTDWATREVAA